jgi:hypothetical protein
MIDDLAALEQVLARAGADRIRHSDRTLLVHLKGTADILCSWGCSGDICRAGMFHSVYGTSSFRCALLTERERPVLREMIGNAAENLAYLFCTLERPLSLDDWPKKLQGRNRITGVTQQLPADSAMALFLIGSANRLEQQRTGQYPLPTAVPVRQDEQ